MKRGALVPDTFAVAFALLGFVLMAFPSLRVAGLIALVLAAAYWLLMAVLKVVRRSGSNGWKAAIDVIPRTCSVAKCGLPV